jgi:hypothetical protein
MANTLIDSVSLRTGSGLRGNNNTENSVSPNPSTIESNETISTKKFEVPGSQNVSNDTRPVDLSETDFRSDYHQGDSSISDTSSNEGTVDTDSDPLVNLLRTYLVPNGPRRFKARQCGKGFKQTHGVNYFDTYAPVLTYTTLRIALTIFLDYETDTIDVTTAILLSPIKEDVYIKLPPGYPCKSWQEGKVLKLQKCLYGLKQASMEWNSELDKSS